MIAGVCLSLSHPSYHSFMSLHSDSHCLLFSVLVYCWHCSTCLLSILPLAPPPLILSPHSVCLLFCILRINLPSIFFFFLLHLLSFVPTSVLSLPFDIPHHRCSDFGDYARPNLARRRFLRLPPVERTGGWSVGGVAKWEETDILETEQTGITAGDSNAIIALYMTCVALLSVTSCAHLFSPITVPIVVLSLLPACCLPRLATVRRTCSLQSQSVRKIDGEEEGVLPGHMDTDMLQWEG